MKAAGAACVSATIFTRAWSALYADDPICGRFLVLRLDRADGNEFGPIPCNEIEIFSMLQVLRPPKVTIASAPGEDVASLQALVERADKFLNVVPQH